MPKGVEKYNSKTSKIELYVSKGFTDMRNKELQNGRLAMPAVAGMTAQECVDSTSILSHLYEFGLTRGS
jgi:hypothetical protein